MRDVSFSYANTPFIEHLSLEIPHARVTSIIGPNGCGKSTLSRLFCGSLSPQRGAVLLAGASVSHMIPNERARKISLLPQGVRAPAMSVEMLVACGRYPYRAHSIRMSAQDHEHVNEAMDLAGISHFRDTDVRFLSGGERQRAFIAMTLAQDTEIIILDEPTTYLDARACHDILQLVNALNVTSGKTIVTIIHDIDLALRYSDQVFVMEEGSITCSSPTKDDNLFEAIEHAFSVSVHKNQVGGKDAYTLFPL